MLGVNTRIVIKNPIEDKMSKCECHVIFKLYISREVTKQSGNQSGIFKVEELKFSENFPGAGKSKRRLLN